MATRCQRDGNILSWTATTKSDGGLRPSNVKCKPEEGASADIDAADILLSLDGKDDENGVVDAMAGAVRLQVAIRVSQ